MGVVFEVSDPTHTDSDFSAQIESYLTGEILFVECKTVGQRFQRSQQMIARDGMDHYLIQVFQKGHTRRLRGQREVIGKAGNILVIDASQPWEALNSDFHNLTLVIPRRLLASQLSHDGDHHGRTIDAGNPFFHLLTSHIVALQKSLKEMSVQDATEASNLSLSLLSLALNKASLESSFSVHENRVSQHLLKDSVKRYLEENLHKTDLTIYSVTDRFRISRAHLYRLFDIEGGIANYIRSRRMDVALRKLTAPGHRAKSVSEIASLVGYKDSSAFSRAFKQKFKLSPLEAKGNLEPQRAPLFEGEKHRVWERWLLEL